MLLLEGYISNFRCARYYFLYVELCDFYINQSLAGQAIPLIVHKYYHKVQDHSLPISNPA
jgi:hypothetical protein